MGFMHDASVAVYERFLGSLSAILTKAEAHCTQRKIEPAALLTFRLFPDMLPLTAQVQLTCDFAARGAARLAGEEPKTFADTESSFAELQARIGAARDYIASFGVERFKGAEGRMITLKQRSGEMVLSGRSYLQVYSMPQFLFHLTTAYNILRHNGIEIGKRDYMGV
jgi:hypothetical protein